MPATPEPSPKRLATHLRRACHAAGYDLDQPRSGAIRDLANATGIPQSTISRILSGDMTPKPSTAQKLADTLGLDVVELLVIAGDIAPRPDTPLPPMPTTLTPEEAADLLNIHLDDRRLFTAFVNRLRNTPPPSRG